MFCIFVFCMILYCYHAVFIFLYFSVCSCFCSYSCTFLYFCHVLLVSYYVSYVRTALFVRIYVSYASYVLYVLISQFFVILLFFYIVLYNFYRRRKSTHPTVLDHISAPWSRRGNMIGGNDSTSFPELTTPSRTPEITN